MLGALVSRSQFVVHRSTRVNGLAVFPITALRHANAPYIDLDQALANGTASITETSEEGSVPELFFLNEGERPVLLVDGEELVGAKQNRVLNLSVLAPARARTRIPVSCVEAGRWSWTSRRFSTADRTLYATARRSKMAGVSRSMSRGSHRSDQHAIWNDIARKSRSFRVHSATGAASEIFERQQKRLDHMVEAIGTHEEQVGAAFAFGGRIAGIELFGSPDFLARLLPKLVRSYGLDALDPDREAVTARGPTLAEVRAMLDAIFAAPLAKHAAVGLGEDLRIEAPELLGAALLHEGELVHLSGFRT